MKIKFLATLSLLLCLIVVGVAQIPKKMESYESQWKAIEQLQKEEKPQSAIKLIDELLAKSKKDGNMGQRLKALMMKSMLKNRINSDSEYELAKELTDILPELTGEDDKAVVHSLLAAVYESNYSNNRWMIDNRTNLEDFVPEDMAEWSSNIYLDKIKHHASKSVENKDALLKASPEKYSGIIEKGVDSKEYYPTLYDFLMRRSISLLEANSDQVSIKNNEAIGNVDAFLTSDISSEYIVLNYYKTYLKNLSDRKLENTFVLTEISRLNYLQSLNSEFPILEHLTKLEEKYQEKEISVDIIFQIATTLRNQGNYSYDNNQEDVDNLKARYDWLKKGVDRFPNSKKITNLKNLLADLENSTAQVSVESIYYPTKEKTIKIKYKNQKTINLKIKDDKGVVVVDEQYNLNSPTTYQIQDTTVSFALDKIGVYTLYIEGAKKEKQEFRVSKLLSLSRTFDGKEFEFFVFDRFSGKPLEGISVEISKADSWNGKTTVIKTIQTEKQGLALYYAEKEAKERYYYYRVLDGKSGDISAYSSLSGNNSYTQNTREQEESVSLFTDRSVYRPGQTVYFKAISYLTQDLKADLLTNKLLKIELYDANGQVVEAKELKTNEFGSVSGEFILPKSTLNGQYSIRTGDRGYCGLRVEEYKRPTFEVKFDKNEETYSFGDKISLKGLAETYSGVKLQGATVSYRITQEVLFFRWNGGESKFIGSGETKTSYDGSFVVDFKIPEKTKKSRTLRYSFPETYIYSIMAEVRDENGEMQTTTTYVYVGEVSMQLKINIQEKFNKETAQAITISAQNLAGAAVEASGDINIYQINKKDTTSVSQMSFKTGEQKLLQEKLKSLASGEYLIKLASKDDKGRKIEAEQSIIVFSPKEKKLPIETNEWVLVNDSSFVNGSVTEKFSANRPAKISIGVSAKDVTIIYEILSEDNKLLSREFLKLNNSIKDLLIPYKEEYKNSITVNFTYVIDEVIYQRDVKLDKERESKKLSLKFEVFRDKLRPGDKEEWRISLLDTKNHPAMAEVLASMYDRSIDQIHQTQTWSLDPIPYHYYSVSTLNGDNTRKSLVEIYKYKGGRKLKAFTYSFDDFISLYSRYNMDVKRYSGVFNEESAIFGSAQALKSSQKQTVGFVPPVLAEDHALREEDKSSAGGAESGGGGEVQIRQNFNETAFFYPHLKTNEKGEVAISFTVPESNTSWKFRALAFDKLLNIGTLEAISVSQKELMVTPNAPRFLREGDRTSISTKVSNLSDKKINGDVKIEFFDPLTEKALAIKVDNQAQRFAIDKDGSTSAQWIFDVPQGVDVVGYRIVAQSETFSDGEQHALSVLPNRMLVTESMPIDVIKAGTKEFTFDRFLNTKSSTADNYRLTFEYAANPAWYAVQALPVLSNPTNENSVNWFASYYANTLASHMLKKYPKVGGMIKAWQESGESKETLVSKLQTNDELKSVLQEETPWVMEAKDETEQMKRLGLLFDLNRTASIQNSAISKLAELQTSSGGWSWYKGIYPSRSITQYILYGFTSLIELNAVEYPQEVREMQMSALKYLDKTILEEYNDLKKRVTSLEKTTSLSTNQLEYLYVRSSYRDIPINHETREAERFYTNIAEKNWQKLSIYERSILLVLVKRNGNKDLAQKIFESLKEYATVKENIGMYWDAPNTNYRCFVSTSSVPVHVFLMKAFEEMNASDEDMNLMKQWLLSQKRTQVWESTHATIEAINILLKMGDDWFGVENGDQIKVGKYEIDMSKSEKGTGYVKQSWAKSEINSELARISIDKKGATPSFGAMYWQYYEDLDKISQQKTGLAVDKKLFKENVTDKGVGLLEVSSKDKLKVGEKVVVRLTVRADRDFDFVHLKDMRAACFEPTQMTSGSQWSRELSYYQETKDASTNFFMDYLPKGTYVLEYSVYVNREGSYSNGISTIQCLYAPEFISHTSGIRVEVAD